MYQVPTPAGQVTVTKEFCLRRAAELLVAADYNLSNINGVINQTGMAVATEAMSSLAQVFIELHDRL